MKNENTRTLRIGDLVRTPQGLTLVVNAFNLPVLQRMSEAGFPSPPPPPKPVRFGPRLAKR
jgi:hypothetical protein